MEQYIKKSALVAELENRIKELRNIHKENEEKLDSIQKTAILLCIDECKVILSILDTLEVREVNIADMADDYYDALMKEAADWMDEGTMGRCRLAYYNGCKDVLNKLQKGE